MDNLKPLTSRQGSLINKAKEKIVDLTHKVNQKMGGSKAEDKPDTN